MNARLTVWTVLLCSVFGLTACGGGGGSDESPGMQTGTQTPPIIETPIVGTPTGITPGSEPKTPVTPTVPETLTELIELSNTVLFADTVATNAPGRLWHPVSVQETPDGLGLEHLGNDPIELAYELAEGSEGVDLARITRPSDYDVATFSYHGWAGWAEHNFFYVTVSELIEDDPLRPSQATFFNSYSIGNATGTHPHGSETFVWKGVMAGIDVSDLDTEGNPVRGDASVYFEHGVSPALDVVFTNIMDLKANTRRRDISWRGVPVTDQGGFDTTGLSGRFYGPNHEEVGGVFINNQILDLGPNTMADTRPEIISGAFAASRADIQSD